MATILKTLACATLASICVLPSLAINVWPRLSQYLAADPTQPELAIVAGLQAVTVLLMAACPFAAVKAQTRGSRLSMVLFGAALVIWNFLNAVEVASHARVAQSDPRAATIAEAARLKHELTVARQERSQLSQFQWTTGETLASVRRAAEASTTAKERECDGGNRRERGDNCRARETDERAAMTRLTSVAAEKAMTDRAIDIDGRVTALEAAYRTLGNIPSQADPGAVRIAHILRLAVDLGDNPEGAVAVWMPTFAGFMYEMVAMFGPIVMRMAFFGVSAPLPKRSTVAPARATVALTVASVASPKKAKRTKAPVAIVGGDVRDFIRSRTMVRPGARMRCKEVYDAYCEWCRTSGVLPVTMTKFGLTMKENGIGFDNKNNRAAYLNIALVGGLKVVAG